MENRKSPSNSGAANHHCGVTTPKLDCDYLHHLAVGIGIRITAVVCGVRRIQSSRYEIGLQMRGQTLAEATYTSLVSFSFSLILCSLLVACFDDSTLYSCRAPERRELVGPAR